MSELDETHMTSLVCSFCGKTVLVSMAKNAIGNLTIECPECGHEHYRYCENGEITEERWRSSAGMYYAYSVRITDTETTDATTYFSRDAWRNYGTAGGW